MLVCKLVCLRIHKSGILAHKKIRFCEHHPATTLVLNRNSFAVSNDVDFFHVAWKTACLSYNLCPDTRPSFTICGNAFI